MLDEFTQSLRIHVPAAIAEADLVSAVQRLLDSHEALRLRVTPAEAGWTLEVMAPGAVNARRCVRRAPVDACGPSLKEIQVETGDASARLSPETGEVLQVVWFDAGAAAPGQLLLVAHHFAVDGVSWRILIADLARAWTSQVAGNATAIDVHGTSLRRWSTLLAEEAQRPSRLAEMSYWRDVLADPEPLGLGTLGATDTFQAAGHLRRTLTTSLTERVLRIGQATFEAGINDILLATLAVAAIRWRHRGDANHAATGLLVDLEGHGRDAPWPTVDVSQTVGWLTSIHPVRLELGGIDVDDAYEGGSTLSNVVAVVKDRLRRVPDHGLGYSLLRYLNPTTACELASRPRSAIAFNYLGRYRLGEPGGDWSLVADRGLGSRVAGATPLTHALTVTTVITEATDGPQLTATWMWAPSLLDAARVSDLADAWWEVIARMAARHRGRAAAGAMTPRDVPLVSLSQSEIDRLQQRYRRPTN